MTQEKTPKALVVGMARSGIAAAAMLRRLGYEVTVNDTKPLEALQEALKPLAGSGVRYALGCPADEWVEGQTLIVVSPGVPLSLPFVQMARERKIPVIAEAELGYRYTRCPIAAITGTNGKTTTTALMGAIFRRAGYTTHVTGNIGLPISQVALDTQPGDRMAFEASSFMLEAIDAFRPKVSAILNITEDHLNRHGTMENYINAKARIFENQREDDAVVLNYDDPLTRALADRAACRVLFFSSRGRVPAGACVLEGKICFIPEPGAEPVVMGRPEEVRLPGRHNLENALAATAMAMAMGISPAIIRYTLAAFEGVEHRIEFVRQIKGVRYINDSKGTNVDSTLAAVRAMEKPTVLIAGGSDKGADFAPLIRGLSDMIVGMVVMGETGPKIAQAAAEAGWGPVVKAATMADAIRKAARMAPSGGNVLLSPACASFDMFKNFEHRGEVFKSLVEAMDGGHDYDGA